MDYCGAAQMLIVVSEQWLRRTVYARRFVGKQLFDENSATSGVRHNKKARPFWRMEKFIGLDRWPTCYFCVDKEPGNEKNEVKKSPDQIKWKVFK